MRLHHRMQMSTACANLPGHMSDGGKAPVQEGDGADVARLKGELQALLAAMQERLHGLERIQDQQNYAIQVRRAHGSTQHSPMPVRML